MILSAVLSQDGTYRYKLTRVWQPELPPVVFIMLNPSTADAMRDDPTIKRCCGFALNWGYGGIEVYNLFAFRATHPIHLQRDTAVGQENDSHLSNIEKNREIICAWGTFRESLGHRDKTVIELLLRQQPRHRLQCLGMTLTGYPRHPVRLAYSTKREDFPLISKEDSDG